MTDFYSQNRCVCSMRSHGPLLCAFCLSFHFKLVQYSLLPTVYICDFLHLVSLSTCGQSVYLWSVCLLVVSLPHYLWSVCLLVVSIHVVSLSTCGQSTCGLFTCGQSVYLWSVYIWSVCLLVMMAKKDHHCTEPNHRVKLRCEVTMQCLKT